MPQADNGISLPLKPSSAERPVADAHHAPPRTREKTRAAAQAVGRLRSGGSLVHAAPPSLAEIWAYHAASARYYNGWIGRWPRWCWGALHIVLVTVLYLLAWATDSFPKFCAAVIVVGGSYYLLGR